MELVVHMRVDRQVAVSHFEKSKEAAASGWAEGPGRENLQCPDTEAGAWMGKEQQQEGREQSQGRDRLVGEEAWGTFRSHGPQGFVADAVMVRTDWQEAGGGSNQEVRAPAHYGSRVPRVSRYVLSAWHFMHGVSLL